MCQLRVLAISFLFIQLACTVNYAQNLILNADFEEYVQLPTDISQLSYCKNIINPSININSKLILDNKSLLY